MQTRKTPKGSRDPLRLVCSTLRDGWQGEVLPHEVRPVANHVDAAVAYARTAGDFGIWMMDAGVPIAKNPLCNRIVTEVAKAYADDDRMGILGFTLADRECIDRTVEATQHAARGGVAILVSPSQHHMPKYIKGPLKGVDLNEIFRRKKKDFARAVEHAATLRQQGLITDVHVYIEDATRMTRRRLRDMVTMMIQAGATSLSLPDTMGAMDCYEYEQLFRHLYEDISETTRRKAFITAHCHNDFGYAVANSLHVARLGLVDGVEATFGGGGPGEGPGNADGNAIAYQLLRGDRTVPLPRRLRKSGLRPELLYQLNQDASAFLGRDIPPKAAVVGESTRTTAAPIHVDGAVKGKKYREENPGTRIEPMYTRDFSEFGVPPGWDFAVDKYVNAKSLRSAFLERDIDIRGIDMDHALSLAIAMATDMNRRLPDDLLEALAWDARFPAARRPVQVDFPSIVPSMTQGRGRKLHVLDVPISYDGDTHRFTGKGKGQFSAFMDAVDQFCSDEFGFTLDISRYDPIAETEKMKKHRGRDARVFTDMVLRVNGDELRSFGFDEAQEWSSFKAVLQAVNRCLHRYPDYTHHI